MADLVGRLKMYLRPGLATPRDLLRELDEASVLIADELTPSLVAQIDWTKRPRLRDRRRQPHLSLRDPGPLARRPGGRRAVRCQPGDSAGPTRRDRRIGERPDRRSERRRPCPRVARHTTIGCWRGTDRTARPAIHRGRLPDPARRQYRVPRRPGGRALCRRRRHRPVPVGVPAYERPAALATSARTNSSSTRSTAPCSRHGARLGDRPHLRPGRGSAACRPLTEGWVADARPGRPPRASRSASEPVAARSVPGRSFARCCGRRTTVRSGLCFHSCPASSSSARPAAWSTRRPPTRRGGEPWRPCRLAS